MKKIPHKQRKYTNIQQFKRKEGTMTGQSHHEMSNNYKDSWSPIF